MESPNTRFAATAAKHSPHAAPSRSRGSRRARHGVRAIAAAGFVAVLAACQGLPVDTTTVPAPRQGATTMRIGTASYSPINRGDQVGAFRTNCQRSHYGWSDPIVFPGQVGASHLHMFFGNGSMTANTTNPMAGTSSTCEGGLANRTGYWVPSMIDTKRNNRVVDAYNGADSIQIYYKSGYDGVEPQDITPYPAGLKMIAGKASGTRLDTKRVWWTCQPGPAITNHTKLASIPTNCPAGSLVQMSVEFPQCWDGKNLDSPDHQSHMAYGLGWPNLGCPSTHPVAVPQITEHIRWTSNGDTSGWRLASDMNPAAPNGASAHADWWNGWDPAVMKSIVDRCIKPGLDCQMNLLGDGRVLN